MTTTKLQHQEKPGVLFLDGKYKLRLCQQQQNRGSQVRPKDEPPNRDEVPE